MLKNLSIFLFLLFVINSKNFAQSKFNWKTATSGGFTYKYVTNDPLKARFYTLKNGLKVILSENHKEPRIQTLIPIRAGSNTDPKEHTGLAHYLEHMLFKGTDKFGSLDWAKEKPLLEKIDALYEKYNHTTDSVARKAIYKEIDETSGEASKYSIANEYDKMMASMGAQGTNAHTWYEETVYEEDVPSNAIDRYLRVQAERFRNPILRIFHTELEAVYEEKNRGLDSDPRKVSELLNESLFPTHNYGQQSTIGTIEHLKNPSLIEIRNFYNKYYVPNNMAVIMAGDLNPDVVIKKIDAAFAFMAPKPIDEYKPAPEAPITTVITKEVYGPTPENITIAWRWPGIMSTQERIVGTVLDELMSNSKAGMIDLNLVKAQKVLRATCSPQWIKDYSIWKMNATPKTGQTLDQIKDLLMGELAKLKKGDFDESIIKAIAANSKLSNIQNFESNNARANNLMESFIQTKGEGWLKTNEIDDKLALVTKQQVMDFANKYCGDGYVLIYKRKGEDKNILKVEKPSITPVETNRDKESEFLKTTNSLAMADIKPVFLDFNKDLKKSKIGISELLYVQNTDNDLFRMNYRFDMGTYHSKLMPIALQYLSFLGTEKLTADQISTEFYKLASSFNTGYTDRHINIGISGLNENYSKTVELFENLMRNCIANDSALELLKGRLMKARNDAKLNKGAILSGLSQYATYGSKNPRNTLNFTDKELQALKAVDIVNFLQDLFNYKHLISYYGPKPIEALKTDLLKSHKLPVNFKNNLPQVAEFKKITPDKNQVLFAEYDMVQAEINWVRPTVQFNATNTAIVDLYNNYFGGGMGSLVFQTIRESKALAYSTYAYYQTPNTSDDKYTMIGYVGTQADKLPEAVKAMNELWANIPLEEKNLAIAKESMLNTYKTERITQDGIINTYLNNLEKGVNNDERKSTFERLSKFTLNDIKLFQEENIANKPVSYCLVGAEKKLNLDEMKKYGEVKKLTLEEIFGY